MVTSWKPPWIGRVVVPFEIGMRPMLAPSSTTHCSPTRTPGYSVTPLPRNVSSPTLAPSATAAPVGVRSN